MDETNVMRLTDENGNLKDSLPESAEKYFNDIIKYLNAKKPAYGSASGLLFPPETDTRPEEIYRPRLSFAEYKYDCNPLTGDSDICLLMTAEYAYQNLSIKYSEHNGYNSGYHAILEWITTANQTIGYGDFITDVKTQKDVIDAIRHRLKTPHRDMPDVSKNANPESDVEFA